MHGMTTPSIPHVSPALRGVSLIGVPTDIGAGTLGARMGPEALRVAGIAHAVAQFGREVKDLRFVDYEAISMLNVSATQELLRKVQVLEARLAAIEARLPSGK